MVPGYNLQRYVVLLLIVLGISLTPLAMTAQEKSKIIPCGLESESGIVVSDECTFTHLIQLVQQVIDFLIYFIASPLAALMFAYAGWLYLSAAGNESQVSQAHNIFFNVLWGFVAILAAWLLVSFILKFFLDPGDSLIFMLK